MSGLKSQTKELKEEVENKLQLITLPTGQGRYIFSVFHSLMTLIAVYLSFRCNSKFNIASFLGALFFPYIYLIYILATKGTCGMIPGEPSRL